MPASTDGTLEALQFSQCDSARTGKVRPLCRLFVSTAASLRQVKDCFQDTRK